MAAFCTRKTSRRRVNLARPKAADLRFPTINSRSRMRSVRIVRAFVFFTGLAAVAAGQSTPQQVHTSPQQDPGVYSGRLKVEYPTPYEFATTEQIRAVLDRIHGYVVDAAPVRVINGDTGEAVTDLSKLPPTIALERTD